MNNKAAVLAIAVCVVFVGGVLAILNVRTYAPKPTDPPPERAAPPPDAGSGVVTPALFDYLQTGMLYSEVTALIGKRGERRQRVQIKSLPGGEGIIEMYVWRNPDGTEVELRFKDSVLMQKLKTDPK